MIELKRALLELVPSVTDVSAVESVQGGCISRAFRARVRMDGAKETLFVKSNDVSFLQNFEDECDGLRRLEQSGAVRVPQPLAVGAAENAAWLVTGWIDERPAGSDFFPRFATALASLHRQTLGNQIGLDRDNFLGAARQINQPCQDWTQFVQIHRLGFQIRWAVDQGLASNRLQQDCDRVIALMDQLLEGRDPQTSLLHGDLWSGNYLCAADNQPVLVDPAIYFGCREAEFGMLRLFGGCPPGFYEAYEEAFPLPSGWQRRVSVYVLYHLLNHLNLFGGGYRDQSERLAAEILRP